jgi:cytidine deaminase
MEQLLDAARETVRNAHVPYSGYGVGAAIETSSGPVYTGCNVEVANYSNSLHAEEVALGTAVAEGHRSFDRLAVVSGERDGVTPCGMCRQTLAEFCSPAFEIACGGSDGVETYRLGELLPEPISAAHLDTEGER